MNIPTKFCFNLPSVLREDQKQTTPNLTPLCLLFLLCTSDQQEKKTPKHQLLTGPSNEHSCQVWYHLAQRFQRRLKCKS